MDSVTLLLPPRDWLVIHEAASRGPLWSRDLDRINQLVLGSGVPGTPGISDFQVCNPVHEHEHDCGLCYFQLLPSQRC